MLYKKAAKLAGNLLLFGFILGISRGYVAVWQDEDPQPLYLTDTLASSLFPADQALLRQGLHFDDQKSLTAALEDFCS